MARRRTPIEDTPGWTIYQELIEYVDSHQVIPNVNAFFEHLVRQGKYAETDKHMYRYYMERRLVEDGLISVDYNTRSIRIVERRIVKLTDELTTAESPVVKKRLSDW